jgi:hypothetical protein
MILDEDLHYIVTSLSDHYIGLRTAGVNSCRVLRPYFRSQVVATILQVAYVILQ